MSARLLWVDDEIDMLKAHILFLQKKDYEVDTASNGPDALDLCRERNYDLILLDENMPGLSGLETLSRLKDIVPTVPVVMVTKNEEEDIMDQAIGSKIADYLIKPVNPSQILLTLKKNIHQREIVQEVTQTGYRQEFTRLGMQMSDNLSPMNGRNSTDASSIGSWNWLKHSHPWTTCCACRRKRPTIASHVSSAATTSIG